MNNENVTAIEFIDNADCIAAISELVCAEISVDYNNPTKPILKICDLEFEEHEFVGKLHDGTIVKV